MSRLTLAAMATSAVMCARAEAYPVTFRLQDQVKRVSGASDLPIAMRYVIRHWQGLTVFLTDGRAEMGSVDDWRGGCRSRGVAVAATTSSGS